MHVNEFNEMIAGHLSNCIASGVQCVNIMVHTNTNITHEHSYPVVFIPRIHYIIVLYNC